MKGHRVQDLLGKTALVTGGTGGIGRAVALELANRGAKIVIVGRDRSKGQAVVAAVQAKGLPLAAFIQADLGQRDEVHKVVQQFEAAHDRLHILVHSAGGHFLERSLTRDGLEINFATNYLSKFLLTNLLLDHLLASAPARVVIVGSPVVNPQRFMQLKGVQGAPWLHPIRSLLTSGLATAVFTVALARRLQGTGVTINNVSPGMVRTDISRSWPAPLRRLDHVQQAVWGISPEEGAGAPVYLATSDHVAGVSGQFYNKMKRVNVHRETYNPQLAEQLWALSERLTGFTFPQVQCRERITEDVTG